MSIVTKTGDKGTTSLIGGERIKKNDPRIEAYGTVDELNAAIGVALVYCKDKTLKETLAQVQHHLFTIGAELSSLTSKKLTMDLPKLKEEHVAFLEKVLYAFEKSLPVQKSFILPNGTESGAHIHLARTICRRAERNVVSLEGFSVNPEVEKYLNRLSDLLWIFSRVENKGKTTEEPVNYK